MTCTEYMDADEATKMAVITAYGVTKNPGLITTIVGTFCTQQPEDTVYAVLDNIRPEFLYN